MKSFIPHWTSPVWQGQSHTPNYLALKNPAVSPNTLHGSTESLPLTYGFTEGKREYFREEEEHEMLTGNSSTISPGISYWPESDIM